MKKLVLILLLMLVANSSFAFDRTKLYYDLEIHQRHIILSDAEDAYHDKRYEDAVKLFTYYSDRYTMIAWAEYMKGMSYWQLGHYRDAYYSFLRSLDLKPEFRLARQALAQLKQDHGNKYPWRK